MGRLGGHTDSTRYLAGGESVLGFEAPITFQDKRVGRVALGIPEKPLTQVARLSIMLLIVLAVVTVLAVAIAMFFVTDWFAKPVRLLSESMGEIAKGRFDHRIRETRKDEFGQLFEVFDAMAAALQARDNLAAAAPATPAYSTPMGEPNPTPMPPPTPTLAATPAEPSKPFTGDGAEFAQTVEIHRPAA